MADVNKVKKLYEELGLVFPDNVAAPASPLVNAAMPAGRAPQPAAQPQAEECKLLPAIYTAAFFEKKVADIARDLDAIIHRKALKNPNVMQAAAIKLSLDVQEGKKLYKELAGCYSSKLRSHLSYFRSAMERVYSCDFLINQATGDFSDEIKALAGDDAAARQTVMESSAFKRGCKVIDQLTNAISKDCRALKEVSK